MVLLCLDLFAYGCLAGPAPGTGPDALASSSPGDVTYTRIENTLTRLGNGRDAVVAQLKTVLYGAEFGGAQPSAAVAATGSSGGLISAASGLLG